MFRIQSANTHLYYSTHLKIKQTYIFRVFFILLNLKAVNIFWPYLMVELHVDDAVYKNHSFFRRVAGSLQYITALIVLH